jgi:hypothetical protein
MQRVEDVDLDKLKIAGRIAARVRDYAFQFSKLLV